MERILVVVVVKTGECYTHNMSQKAQKIIEIIRPILIKHGVTRAQLFGSIARGDANSDSDVDVLVQMPESSSLFDKSRMYGEIKDILHTEIDLVSYRAINPRLRESIFQSTLDII
jgi:predicted nucleotidyltransferase